MRFVSIPALYPLSSLLSSTTRKDRNLYTKLFWQLFHSPHPPCHLSTFKIHWNPFDIIPSGKWHFPTKCDKKKKKKRGRGKQLKHKLWPRVLVQKCRRKAEGKKKKKKKEKKEAEEKRKRTKKKKRKTVSNKLSKASRESTAASAQHNKTLSHAAKLKPPSLHTEHVWQKHPKHRFVQWLDVHETHHQQQRAHHNS